MGVVLVVVDAADGSVPKPTLELSRWRGGWVSRGCGGVRAVGG